MHNKHATSKKIIAWLLIYSHLLAGCVTTGGQNSAVKVGPTPSTSHEEKAAAKLDPMTVKLDVIIPAFDPGLPEDEDDYEKQGIWPELRRAEANRFAYQLKQALDESNAFGAVRVTPDKTASGDLYLLGKIEKSNGKDVKFALNVIDISGKEWLNESFKHEVREYFYKNYRNRGTDPYAPVFKQATNKIISILKKRNSSELTDLQYIASLKFGASFNASVFTEYMNTNGRYIKLLSKPSDDDPMLRRVTSIRVREQLFVDGLQQYYASFSQKMDESYSKWQEASFIENKLHSEAKTESLMKGLGGVLLLGLSVASLIASKNTGKSGSKAGLELAAIGGGLAGAWMLSSSFKSKEEAKLHKGAIDELGESMNMELASRVVSFENETIELTGNMQEQFAQWRTFLKRIYQQEATPDIAL